LLGIIDELGISKDRLNKSLEILEQNGYIKGFDITKTGKNILKTLISRSLELTTNTP